MRPMCGIEGWNGLSALCYRDNQKPWAAPKAGMNCAFGAKMKLKKHHGPNSCDERFLSNAVPRKLRKNDDYRYPAQELWRVVVAG